MSNRNKAASGTGIWPGMAGAVFLPMPGRMERNPSDEWQVVTRGWVREIERKPDGTKVIGPPTVPRRSTAGVLTALLGLRGEDVEGRRLGDFVHEYGALPLCVHRKRFGRCQKGGSAGGCSKILSPQPQAVFVEEAKYYAALLEIGDALWNDRVPPPQTWKAARSSSVPTELEWAREAHGAFLVGRELAHGTVGVSLKWDRGGANLLIGSTAQDLWAALARAVLFRLLRVERPAFCAGCDKMLEAVGKGRRPGQRYWCGRRSCELKRGRLKASRHRRKVRLG